MPKFVYVFDKDTRDALVKAGYFILKDDHDNDQYIFINNENILSDLGDASYILSDTMLF